MDNHARTIEFKIRFFYMYSYIRYKFNMGRYIRKKKRNVKIVTVPPQYKNRKIHIRYINIVFME